MAKSIRSVGIFQCGEHAWIPLTRGFVAFCDPEFAPAADLWKWRSQLGARNVYAVRTHREKVGGKRRLLTIPFHKMVLPASSGFVVDHIDGNTLNNRRSNLRLATISENAINQRHRAGTTSKYRGVSRAGVHWRACIGLNGRQSYLGRFPTEDDAARAYDEAALRIHGEFACLNFTEQKRAA